MRLNTLLIASCAIAPSACASYVLPVPAGFTAADALAVTGATGFKQKQMMIGDYSVEIDRSSTKDRTEGGVVTDRSKRQGYSFVIKQAGTTVFTGGCELTSDALRVGAPGGIEINAKENTELECEMLPKGTGRDSWRLELSGKPDNPLNGRITGATVNYTIEGVGGAIGSMKHGPTTGYYIKQDERTIASIQVTGKRQVLFGPDSRTDPLIAAAVALLLIDESVRDMDD